MNFLQCKYNTNPIQEREYVSILLHKIEDRRSYMLLSSSKRKKGAQNFGRRIFRPRRSAQPEIPELFWPGPKSENFF
jgi:hypothetical protein